MRKPLNRAARYKLAHCRDIYENTGFDYREDMFRKNLSKQLYADPKAAGMLDQMQRIMFWLTEEVKTLRTRFAFAVGSDAKNIR